MPRLFSRVIQVALVAVGYTLLAGCASMYGKSSDSGANRMATSAAHGVAEDKLGH